MIPAALASARCVRSRTRVPRTPGPRPAAPALAAAVLLALSSLAHAAAIRVEFFTLVGQGQRPRLVLHADEAVDRATVELKREDGHKISVAVGALARGASREIPLPAEPGRHHYSGRLTVTRGGSSSEEALEFDAIVAPPLQIQLDRSKVDLAARRLELKVGRAPGKVEVKVFGDTGGEPIAAAEHDFTGQDAGAPLAITWPEPEGGAAPARIDVVAHDRDGFFAGVRLVPWSVTIPHEEVNFAVDRADVRPSEAPKLEGSLKLISEALARHKDLGPIRLYIAGHTDSQAGTAYNLALSRRRARAIGAWFRRRGLGIPIFHEGFGESAPLVATPDETDEPRNRRVDYILSIEDPALKATSFRPVWKRAP